MKPDLKHSDKERPRRGRGPLWFVAGIIVALIIIFVFPKLHYALKHAGTTAAKNAEALNKTLRGKKGKPAPAASTNANAKAPRFDFYELLKHPTQILTSSESNEVKTQPTASAVVTHSGKYILQVASLRDDAQAEKLKARLALWGIVSHIQKVQIQGETWHRVRVGPVSDLASLNALRKKLHSHQIKPLLIRVGN
ncbi:MAG: SPOR domain-containing protein [Gammaproteobacteria bacterium]